MWVGPSPPPVSLLDRPACEIRPVGPGMLWPVPIEAGGGMRRAAGRGSAAGAQAHTSGRPNPLSCAAPGFP